MQFGRLFLAAAASTAVQALELTDSTFAGITVGETFDITWTGATGDVTLILVDDANPLNSLPVATIACMPILTSPAHLSLEKVADNLSYSWLDWHFIPMDPFVDPHQRSRLCHQDC